MKSSNPMFRDSLLKNNYDLSVRPMSVAGTMNKLLLLTFLVLLAGAGVFYQLSLGHLDFVKIISNVGVGVSIVLIFLMGFMPKLTPYLAPIFAFAYGASISFYSLVLESIFPGIVIQAIGMTFLVVFVMAFLFKMKIIQATEKFRSIVTTAGFAVFIFYIGSWIFSLFGIQNPYFVSSSPLAIVVNVVIAILASLFLILDFDNIEKGVQRGLPSFFEWHCAVGLLTTVIWLYIEILRILSRLRDN